MPKHEARAFKAYCGHFWAYLDDFLGTPTRKLTILRDPVDRTISQYAHIRRLTTDVPDTLAGFVADPRWRHSIENTQARYIAQRGQNFIRLSNCFGPENLTGGLVETILHSLQWPTAGTLLTDAMRELDSYLHVGVQDRFDDEMARIANGLGLQPHTPFARANVSENRAEVGACDSVTRKAIQRLTEADQVLYDYAAQGRWRNF